MDFKYDKEKIAQTVVEIALFLIAVVISVLMLDIPSLEETIYGTDLLFRRSILISLLTTSLFLLGKRKIRWGFTDIFLFVLAAIYIISAKINNCKAAVIFFQEAIPFILLYFSVKIFVSIGEKLALNYLMIIFFLSLCIESIIGLLQVLGFISSRNISVGMTGSFLNPGPFGGYIAMIMSVSSVIVMKYLRGKSIVCYDRKRSVIIHHIIVTCASCATFLGILVLPASSSRAGWLAYALSMILYLCLETSFVQRMKKQRIIVGFSLIFVTFLLTGMFLLKKNSALGRLHIWHMELRAIVSEPFIGTGPGTALGTYGKVQERFFREDINDATSALNIAGCPEFAFNEYFKTGIETGIIGTILSFVIITVSVISLLKKRTALAYGLVSAAIFSFFSYPLSILRIAVIITLLLSVASCQIPLPHIVSWSTLACLLTGAFFTKNVFIERSQAVHEWKMISQWPEIGLSDKLLQSFSDLYDNMYWNYQYLYDYGYALHKAGDYDFSNKVLTEGALLSSDPMFHNIIGQNFELLHQYDSAEREYLKAHYMVPCRLYPLMLLMEMYHSRGMESKALELGEKILLMPVNEKNRLMVDLHERVLAQIKDWKKEKV